MKIKKKSKDTTTKLSAAWPYQIAIKWEWRGPSSPGGVSCIVINHSSNFHLSNSKVYLINFAYNWIEFFQNIEKAKTKFTHNYNMVWPITSRCLRQTQTYIYIYLYIYHFTTQNKKIISSTLTQGLQQYAVLLFGTCNKWHYRHLIFSSLYSLQSNTIFY